MKQQTTSYSVAVAIGIFLAILLAFTMYQLYRQSYAATDHVISEQVEELHRILTHIDTTCEIVAIRRNHSVIDFLQVAKFAGTEIGPLQLRYPEKWRGPYVEQNPIIQGKLYELVKTHDGFVITPGNGVVLSNGKTIGTDIIFNETVDVDLYLNEAVGLEFQTHPLIMKLPLKHTTIRPAPSMLESDID